MFKYLYEKYYSKDSIERKLFSTSNELYEYLFKEGECIFNSGFSNAEIRLYRIQVEGSGKK